MTRRVSYEVLIPSEKRSNSIKFWNKIDFFPPNVSWFLYRWKKYIRQPDKNKDIDRTTNFAAVVVLGEIWRIRTQKTSPLPICRDSWVHTNRNHARINQRYRHQSSHEPRLSLIVDFSIAVVPGRRSLDRSQSSLDTCPVVTSMYTVSYLSGGFHF